MVESSVTRLFLVRHGETEWNKEGRIQGVADSPLTERGRLQASYMGESLLTLGVPFTEMYSSPISRATETATIIGDKLGKAYRLDERMKERNFGIFEGFTRKEVAQKFPHEVKMNREQSGFVIPKGESREHLLNRVKECFSDLVALHGGEDVLLVTHGGWISMALRYVLHIPMIIENRFVIDNTHLTIIAHSPEHGWQVERVGGITVDQR